MTRRFVWWIVLVGPFVLALAVYGWQGSRTPLLNSAEKAQARYLAELTSRLDAETPIDTAAAAAYWVRYPDVAADRFYGRNGPLGHTGALQHFRDHGQREGRKWGQ